MSLRLAIHASAISHVVTIASGLLSVPLFLSAFGLQNFGFWSALLGLSSYLSLLNFGVAQAVSSGASRAPKNSPTAVPRLVQQGLRFYVRVSAVAIPVAAVVGLSCPWSAWFGMGEANDLSSRLAAAAVFTTFLLELPFTVFRASLSGAGYVATERMLGITLLLARLAMSFVFSRMHPPLWLAVLALSSLNLGASAITCLALRRHFPLLLSPLPSHDSPTSEAGDAEQGNVDRFGSMSRDFFILQIAGALVWSTDALIAGIALDTTAAAHVATAWRVISIVLSVGAIVAPAVAPTLAQLWSSGEKERARALSMEAAQVVFALMIVGTLGLSTTGASLFTLWLGEGKFAGQGPWQVYSAIIVVQALLVIPDAFVTQSASHRGYARFTVVEALLKISSSLVLMHFFGLIGLPLGTILSRAATTLWLLPTVFVKATEQSLSSWALNVIRPALLPSSSFLAIFLIGTSVLGFSSDLATVVTGVVAGLVFLVAFALFGLPPRLRTRLLRRSEAS
jgi:O-antigen/teichoic acid export membrane protein